MKAYSHSSQFLSLNDPQYVDLIFTVPDLDFFELGFEFEMTKDGSLIRGNLI